MNISLLTKNLLDTATVTVTTSAAGYPVARLYDRARSFQWKANTLVAHLIDVDCGYSQSASTWVCLNHNIRNYVATVMADSPQAYWRLDEASGAVATDVSGNGNNGTYHAPIMYGHPSLLIADPNASIMNINPAAGGGYMGASLTMTGRWSLEAWINIQALTPYRVFGSNVGSGVPGIAINADGSVSLVWKDVGGTERSISSSPGSIVAGTTYHVVGTHDAATSANLYINGGLAIGSGAYDSNNLGAVAVEVARCDAVVDEAAIYTTDLSSARVLAHYVSGTQGPTMALDGKDVSPADVTVLRALVWATSPTYGLTKLAPGDPFYATFTPVSYRWWRVTLPAVTAPDTALAIGEMFLGVPNVIASPSIARVTEVSTGNVQTDESPAGYVWKIKKGAPRLQLTYGWDTMSAADVAALRQAWSECGEGSKNFVLVDADGTARWVEFVSTNITSKRFAMGGGREFHNVECVFREAL